MIYCLLKEVTLEGNIFWWDKWNKATQWHNESIVRSKMHGHLGGASHSCHSLPATSREPGMLEAILKIICRCALLWNFPEREMSEADPRGSSFPCLVARV